MPTKKLHLLHFSTQVFDNATQARSDLRNAFELEPDMASFTEIIGKERQNLFKEVARNHGYTPVTYGAPNSDAAFAIKNSEAKVKDRDLVAGTETVNLRGNKLNNYISMVKVRWNDLDIWLHCGHWPAHLLDLPRNVPKHDAMTRVLVANVKKHGQGANALSFYSGDTNTDETPGGKTNGAKFNQICHAGGLASIWDEKQTYPGTMNPNGRTLDTIGRLTREERSKALRAKIHPKWHSDHRAISAWYEIDIKRSGATPSGQPANLPSKGDQTGDKADDDIYATGGNQSWKDYQDGRIYQLNAAVDDTDTENG